MTTPHTPGPWTVVNVKSKTGHAYIVGNGEQVGRASYGSLHMEANARLIAAAPQMLKLLRDGLGDLECVAPDGCYHCDVHALLATVEGRT